MEMDRIQHSLKMLQETHMAIKQQYEDEISRLRHLLESHPHSQGSDPEGRGPVRPVQLQDSYLYRALLSIIEKSMVFRLVPEFLFVVMNRIVVARADYGEVGCMWKSVAASQACPCVARTVLMAFRSDALGRLGREVLLRGFLTPSVSIARCACLFFSSSLSLSWNFSALHVARLCRRQRKFVGIAHESTTFQNASGGKESDWS